MNAARRPLPKRRIAVAPMMNRTDAHFRYLVRLISRRTWLYSEMVVARALLHGNAARLLAHDERESPLALQVGGSEPAVLARAAELAAEHGFDEINLNVGCPSPRVTAGRMGACLMAEPRLVADCVAAMRAAGGLPVTVKTRIGIDERDDEAFLDEFADAVRGAGCAALIVHARKAWLHGLDPKANRTVPPLRYERVFALKRRRPELEVLVNGGIGSLETAQEMLGEVDGVMIGRAAYARPLLLAEADRRVHGDRRPTASLPEVLDAYLDHVGRSVARGMRLGPALRHVPGLLAAEPGVRNVRRRLCELAGGRDVGAVRQALEAFLATREAA